MSAPADSSALRAEEPAPSLTRRFRLRTFLHRFASVAAIAVLAVLIWRAHPRALLTQLLQANLWLVAAAMVLNFVQIAFKAQRMRTLLSPAIAIPLRRLYAYVLIGYAGNNVLPVRGGEVVRLRLLQQRERVAVGTFVGVFSAERILDAASVLAVAGTLPLVAPLPAPARAGLALLAGVAIGGYVVLLILARSAAVPAGAGRLRRFLGDLARGAHAMRRPRLLIENLITSIAALGVEALIIVLVLRGLGMPLSAGAPALVILCVNLALVAPSAPAHVGSFEAGAVLGLSLCGVAQAPALAFALLYHIVHLVPVTLAGAVAWARLPAAERVTVQGGTCPSPLVGTTETRSQASGGPTSLPPPRAAPREISPDMPPGSGARSQFNDASGAPAAPVVVPLRKPLE
ncbi:MAG TPA: lysylphosphatidylglycerol synthase transmembrane domain-containing protein [Polyangia bacterium]